MKYLQITFLSVLTLVFASCEKTESFNNDDRTVGHSTVTYFASITMNGDRYMSVVQGSSFTDPGATATEAGSSIPVTVSGTVNTAAVGAYDITYSATNSDGFSSSVVRTVAVLPAPEQPGVNIAGKYYYVNNPSYVATMQKLAPGFYVVDNVWGANNIPSYVITVDGAVLTLPEASLSGYGPVRGTGTLDAAGNLQYKVDLLAYGLLNITRNWKKL